MNIRPVIFDMDGVLADSEAISCRVMAEVLSSHGARLDAEEVRQRFVGMASPKSIQIIADEQNLRFPDDIVIEVRERSLQAYEGHLKPIAGMVELIQSSSFPRCVASSSSPIRIEKTLETIGLLDDLAPHLFSATMVENGKPAPDLFLFAARKMGWSPKDCIVIEDSLAGVQAGIAAGMTVLGLTAGEHVIHAEHAPKLAKLGAHKVLPDSAALKRELVSLGVAISIRSS